jgi:hypothetical protein
MAKLYNLARMTTATAGTGAITLGSAVSGYLTFAAAGVSNGETVTYGIKDGSGSEIGEGVYTASGTTLTRSVIKSTNSDSAISLSGSAEVFITPSHRHFFDVESPEDVPALVNVPYAVVRQSQVKPKIDGSVAYHAANVSQKITRSPNISQMFKMFADERTKPARRFLM